MTWVWVTLVGTGLLLAGLALPLWAGRVPPNAFYGFRTPRTTTDPEVWYPVNRIAGRDLFVGGIGMIGTAAGAWLVLPPDPDGSLAVALALAHVPLVLSLLHSFWAASVLVAELDARRAGEPEPPAQRQAVPYGTPPGVAVGAGQKWAARASSEDQSSRRDTGS